MALADKRMANANTVQKKAIGLQNELNEKINKIDKKLEHLEKREKNKAKLIQNEAEILNNQFKEKWSIIAMTIITYCVVVTILTALKSEYCMNDMVAVIEKIIKFFKGYFSISFQLVQTIFSDCFTKLSVGNVVKILFGIVAAILCFLLPVAVIVIPIAWLVTQFMEHCKDELSLFVALTCLCISVWGAVILPCNSLLFFIGSQILYIIIRWYIYGYKEARRPY